MGLDVYVGPLTRYYTGDWETIVQQFGRESGIRVEVVRRNATPQSWLSRLFDLLRGKDNESASDAVLRWQLKLRRELRMPDLDWDEDPLGEYFTDKPAWDCYGALVLWACYEELPKALRRETAEDWDKDPAYLTTRVNPNSRYVHLVADTEIWLPVDFPNPIGTTAVTGETVEVGSSVRLLQELRELNERTWAVDEAKFSQWRQEGAEYGGPLEISARLAFSIFYVMANHSVQQRLPMKPDY